MVLPYRVVWRVGCYRHMYVYGDCGDRKETQGDEPITNEREKKDARIDRAKV